MPNLSNRARIFITATVVLGLGALATGLPSWNPSDPLRFAFYLSITLLCSSLKLVLPGVHGNMSVFNIMVLVGILELSLGETLAMGLAATVLQSYWHTRSRPQPVQVAFNVASVAVATTGAWWAFQSLGALPAVSHPALKLAGAAAAYFLLNTISIATVIALTSSQNIFETWRTCYVWTFPYYLLGASIAGAMSAISGRFGWQVSALVLPVVYGVYHSYRMYLTRLEQENLHSQEVAGLHLRTIEALALAIEAKDDTTHEHLRRVQVYADELGKDLRLPVDEQKALQAASILHDIGKLAVPDYIISKPGKLTPEEFDKMKIHPVVGAEILERVQFPYPVVPIVRHHHEKWDGTGYPDGLKGEQIPMGARILSAVDCLDALASDRQYRRALPMEKALEIVVAESGKAFDPRVTEILARRAPELEEKARKLSGTERPPTKLSTEVKIERGLQPDAGFERTADHRPGSGPDFLTTIARARQEVVAVQDLIHHLGNSLNVRETMALLASRLKQMIPHDAMAIYIRRGDCLHPAFVAGEGSAMFASLEIPVGQGLSGWVAENAKAIVNGNPAVESGYLNDPSKITRLRSALAVPLIEPLAERMPGPKPATQAGADGPPSGVLALYHLEKDAFSRDHLRILSALNLKLSVAIHNALRFQEAEHGAATDALTGLANPRSLFLTLDSELSRCRRSREGLTVLVCDLDRFKEVNDRFGHLAGNRALVGFGRAAVDSCREYDCVARMGGDEFVIVLPGFPPESIPSKIESLHGIALEVGQEVCGKAFLGVSVGHAHFPDDGEDAEQLLAVADRRMYQAKRCAHDQEAVPS